MNSINSVSSAVCSSCNVYLSWLFISTLTLFVGCGDSNPVPIVDSSSDSIEDKSQEKIPANSLEKAEPDDQLDRLSLSNSRLAESEASEGWIKLFDGVTLFGWETDGKANFRVEDGLLVVDEGEMSLLCTSMKWDNYELLVEYRADSEVNSGIFLNTDLVPGDVATECYEINIAPSSHPFSTGSLVNREAASNVPAASGDNWRTLKISHRSGELSINLDGVDVCNYEDPKPPSAGKIGLQHNSGRIEFRRVMLRPLDLKSLLDSDLALWKQYPDMDAKYSVTESGWMRVQGGSGQIETSEQYDDFVLLAEYKLPTPEMNSGIFFRCIPGDKMMGYECQVSNFGSDEDPLVPADCGTGGIFRRQDARFIAGDNEKWVTVILQARGPSMSAWVNGVQVSNWTDTREKNENPRRGSRLEAGTIMVQGHDPKTDALFKQFKIRSVN